MLQMLEFGRVKSSLIVKLPAALNTFTIIELKALGAEKPAPKSQENNDPEGQPIAVNFMTAGIQPEVLFAVKSIPMH